MTPPPMVCSLLCKKSDGSPIILPSQSMTMVSNSVQAGLDAWNRKQTLEYLISPRTTGK